MPPLPLLEPAIVTALAKALDFLTGSEITALAGTTGLVDPLGPGATKWRRMEAAFQEQQQRDRCANRVLAFAREALAPARFLGDRDAHDASRATVNQALAFAGYTVGEDGSVQQVSRARTLSEAEERAGRLRAELERRHVHADVLRYCRAELLVENYFHAVFEATKSVADKLRAKSGLTSDGAQLVDEALALGKAGYPRLAFNTLQTETEKSEHKGLAMLLKGMFGAFRNVTAHAPKIAWTIEERDALDLLTLASLLHRRLDGAVRTP